MPYETKTSIYSKTIVFFISITLAYSLFAHFYPQIDLWVSDQFYNPTSGFILNHNPILVFFRNVNYYSPIFMGSLALLSLLLYRIGAKTKLLQPYQSVFILMVYLWGAFIIPQTLKLIFSRPRPYMTTNFGGTYLFHAPWEIADHFSFHSWSFPSAESTSAMALMTLPWCIARPSLRKWLIAILSIFVIFISFNRLMFGAHFLSDIVTSWAIILITIPICWHYCQKYKETINHFTIQKFKR